MKKLLVWVGVPLTRLCKYSIICMLFLISCNKSERVQNQHEEPFLSSVTFQQTTEKPDFKEFDSVLKRSLSNKSQHHVDSLLNITKNKFIDTSTAAAYVELSKLFGPINQNISYQYSQKAIQICEQKLRKKLDSELKKSYLKSLAGGYNAIGYVNIIWGNLYMSLDYFNHALGISLDIGDKNGIARSYYEIGYVFHLQNEASKALEYYNKSLKIRKQLGNLMDISATLNNIGGIYLNENEFPVAKEFFLKSMEIREKIDDQEGIGYCLNNISVCLVYQGDYETSLEYLEKSLEIRERIGDKKGIIESLNNIATNHIWLGDFDKALEYSLKSLAMAEQYKMLKHIGDASEVLSYIYENEKNDPENALKYYRQFIQMRDSVDNEVIRKKAVEIYYNREFKIKEALLKENNRQEIKLSRIKVSVITFVFVLIILFFLIWVYFYRKRKETEKLLFEREVSLEVAATERRRIAADLHDDLGAGIAGLGLITGLLSQRSTKEEMMTDALKVSSKVKDISKRLKEVIWEINIEHDNLEDLLLFIQKQGNLLFKEASIQFSMILPLNIPDVKVHSSDRRNIYFAVKELFTNVIKHSDASVSRCEVVIDNNLILTVFDNGKGFSESEMIAGEGLRNLRYRVEQMNGKIRTESIEKTGTKSTIIIPLNQNL